MSTPLVLDLGRVPFAQTHARMLALAEQVADGTTPGEVWLLEHDPIFTAGRASPDADVVASGATRIERGGQITYHGPGQLVVYPVVRLPERDVGAWLRRLTAFGAAVCAELGLQASASENGTGVYVAGRKVGSIGVALRRWVNLHGIALNVDMDLAPFFAVQPCGLPPALMSDLSRAAGRAIPRAEAVAAARRALVELGLGDAG